MSFMTRIAGRFLRRAPRVGHQSRFLSSGFPFDWKKDEEESAPVSPKMGGSASSMASGSELAFDPPAKAPISFEGDVGLIAEELYNLSHAEDRVTEVLQEIMAIADVDLGELTEALEPESTDPDEIEYEAMLTMARYGAGPLLANAVAKLVRIGDLDNLSVLLEYAAETYLKALGFVRFDVTVSSEYQEENMKEKIMPILQRMIASNQRPFPIFTSDPSIIAGMKIEYQGKSLDYSMSKVLDHTIKNAVYGGQTQQ